MKILNKFNRFMVYLAPKVDKSSSKVSEICGQVEPPANTVSVYNTKCFFLPDYDKVSVDISKKGWQRKLKFNDKNINPNFTQAAYAENLTVNYLKPKQKIGDYEHIFYQTTDSIPMEVVISPNAGIMIDNFSSPGGTIAIEGNLSDTFYTKELYQCAGVSIVDRSKNLQKLLHFYLYSDERDSLRLIKFLTRGLKEPEITLIPGTREETNRSIVFLTDVFKDFFPNLQLKYMHVPENFNVKDTYIGLNNGNVFCSKMDSDLITEVNPKSKIIFI